MLNRRNFLAFIGGLAVVTAATAANAAPMQSIATTPPATDDTLVTQVRRGGRGRGRGWGRRRGRRVGWYRGRGRAWGRRRRFGW